MVKAIVCGAGAAGLGAAAALSRSGVDVEVLERSDGVAASWRGRYDDLRLNTPGRMSSLPGYRADIRRYGEFPLRDDWIRCLEDHRADHGIHIRFGIEVISISRSTDGWQIHTTGGTMECDVVVVALGLDRRPWMPDWPGATDYRGEIIHSSAFRNAASYESRDVLVVGPNVSGSEIAHLLVAGGADRVRLSCRTPPNLMRRKFLGLPVNVPGVVLNRAPARVVDQITWLMQLTMFGRLDTYGLSRAPYGVATNLRLRQQAPAYDDGDGFVADVKAGRIEIVPAVAGFAGDRVVLADGSHLRTDAVIAATGYRTGLEPLIGHLGVLDGDGMPTVSGGDNGPRAPELYFTGYRGDLGGQLRLMRYDARSIARAVHRSRFGRIGPLRRPSHQRRDSDQGPDLEVTPRCEGVSLSENVVPEAD